MAEKKISTPIPLGTDQDPRAHGTSGVRRLGNQQREAQREADRLAEKFAKERSTGRGKSRRA